MQRTLGLRLDPQQRQPLYRQLFDQVAERIRSGAFPAGFRLPPSRHLARELGAHRNTVARAYTALERAGFVTSTVGRGTFVSEQVGAPRAVPTGRVVHGQELPWQTLLSSAASSEPLGRFDRLARSVGSGRFINLTRMQPAPELMPQDLFGRCIDHVLRTTGAHALGYAPREGVPALRERIAEDLARQGIPADPDDVIVTTGSQQALHALATALLDPGDLVLLEGSTYSGAINAFAARGARLLPVPSEDEGPDVPSLHRVARGGVKALYLMPNHRNPTGDSISAARREALVQWSHQAGVPLIEDDYAADLDLEGHPCPPALRALDGQVLFVGTYSKKLMPALRVGFLLAPRSLRSRLLSIKQSVDLGTSALLQHALAEFLGRGYMRAHLARVLPAYRARRDALEHALLEHLPEPVQLRRATRGVTSWLTLPDGIDSGEVFEWALREGIMVSPGTLHRVDEGEQAGIRLSFCYEDEDRLAEGGRRLGKLLAKAVDNRPSNRSSGVSPLAIV